MRVWKEQDISDIRRDYRSGVSIEVLSDLNACTTDEICEIVGEVKIVKKIPLPKDKLKPMKITDENEAELYRLFREDYDSGANDREIERRRNCSYWKVREWRINAELPPIDLKRARGRCI